MTKETASSLSAECYAMASTLAYTLREIAHEIEVNGENQLVDALFGCSDIAGIIAERSLEASSTAFSIEEA